MKLILHVSLSKGRNVEAGANRGSSDDDLIVTELRVSERHDEMMINHYSLSYSHLGHTSTK